jgi:hypothetical protein
VLRPLAKSALQQRADVAAAAHREAANAESEGDSDLDSCSDDDAAADAGGADVALAEAGGLDLAEGGLHANTIMWRRVQSLPSAATLYGETMHAAKPGMTMVGTSVMDERAFSAMLFVKNHLRAKLTKDLKLCMRAQLQDHFNVRSCTALSSRCIARVHADRCSR